MSWMKKMGDKAVKQMMAEQSDLTGQVRMRWHADYWDGPLSGYVELNGIDGYWVECAADYWDNRPGAADDSCTGEDGDGGCEEYPGGGKCCMDTWDRVFLVFELDPEQERIALSNHELFRKYVGTHTDYDKNGSRSAGKKDWNAENAANGDANSLTLAPGLKPRKTWDKFYKAKRPEMPPVSFDQVVGYTLSLFPGRS